MPATVAKRRHLKRINIVYVYSRSSSCCSQDWYYCTLQCRILTHLHHLYNIYIVKEGNQHNSTMATDARSFTCPTWTRQSTNPPSYQSSFSSTGVHIPRQSTFSSCGVRARLSAHNHVFSLPTCAFNTAIFLHHVCPSVKITKSSRWPYLLPSALN